MAGKIIGKAREVTGRWPRRWVALVALVLSVGAGSVFIRTVLAVHDTGRFELEGDTISAATDDWDRVCHEATGSAACGTNSNTTGANPDGSFGAKAVSWSGDCEIGSSGIGCSDTNATIFTGGGSKDPQDVNQWAWKDGAGGLPDKDNLVHAFAARYSILSTGATSGTCPSGTFATCEVIYFGSDRFDNSGDAQQGFWFLQNKVTLGTNAVGGGQGFSGLHKNGDLLVISDFSNGGTKSTITVMKWDTTCTATDNSKNPPPQPCADANLRRLRTSDAALCGPGQSGDPFCGIVNPADGTPSAWSSDYTDKSGNHSYLQGEFYEAGVNLSTLNLGGECFSSVVSETRSATSTTAQLKDFVLGNFATCVPDMATVASATVAAPVTPGTAVHDTATITVTGGTSPADPTGTVTFFLCGPIASGDCSTGGTNVGKGALNGGANTTDGVAIAQSPDVNTAASITGVLSPGRYCFRAEWPGDGTYGALSHTNSTTECFGVKDTSTTVTAQDWLPQDTATVKLSGGGNASGTVVFTLYSNGTCTPAVAPATDPTFTKTLVNGSATTDNTTHYLAPGTTISWKAVFTPSDPNAVGGSTGSCESSVLTINNNPNVP